MTTLTSSLSNDQESAIGIFPFIATLRLVGLDVEGTTHDLPSLRQRGYVFQCHHLHQDVADGRGLDGTGYHVPPGGIGGELVERPVPRSAADGVELLAVALSQHGSAALSAQVEG
jgi:hypothetical protein